jgi:hypothetical protein
MSKGAIMQRSDIVSTLRACVLAAVLVFLGTGIVSAGGISFGGDPPDNLWNIHVRDCLNGFTVHARQTRLSNQPKRFSLRLSYSSIRLTTKLPRRIAGGSGSSIAEHRHVQGTLTVLFRHPQPAGTSISIAIQRLDRGLTHPDAPDDVLHIKRTLQNCIVHQ